MDPLFIDPDGPDDMLGGAHGADDNFRLQQVAAGESADSPGVEAGSDTAVQLGLDNKTTRSDDVPDGGVVDLGYHYPIPFTARLHLP